MSVEINATNFPDSVFRAYLSDVYDKDDDGILNDQELSNITRLDINDASLRSYVGISKLPYLNYLVLSNSVNTDTISQLEAELRACTSLEKIASGVTWTGSSLNLTGCTSLTEVHLGAGYLESLTLGNLPHLKQLSCWKTNAPYITTLDISGCPILKRLVYDATMNDTADLATFLKSNGWVADFFSYTRGEKNSVKDELLEFNIDTVLDPNPLQPTNVRPLSNTTLGSLISIKETIPGLTTPRIKTVPYIFLGLDSDDNARLLREEVDVPASIFLAYNGKKTPVGAIHFNGISIIDYPWPDRYIEVLESPNINTFDGTVWPYGSCSSRNLSVNSYKLSGEIIIKPFTNINVAENGIRLGAYYFDLSASNSASAEGHKFCATTDENGITLVIPNNKCLVSIALFAKKDERILNQTLKIEVYKKVNGKLTLIEDAFNVVPHDMERDASTYVTAYENSALDSWLQTKFLDRFDSKTLALFSDAALDVSDYSTGVNPTKKQITRKAFLPSAFELGNNSSAESASGNEYSYEEALKTFYDTVDENAARNKKQEPQTEQLVFYGGQHYYPENSNYGETTNFDGSAILYGIPDALDETEGCLYWTRSSSAYRTFIAVNRNGTFFNANGARKDLHIRPMISLDAETLIGTNAYGENILVTDISSNPPVITVQPVSVSINAGDEAYFTIGSRGSDVTYQWQKLNDEAEWENIDGATNAEYTIIGAFDLSGLTLRCKLSNPYGDTFSDIVTLSINSDTRSVSPQSLSLREGEEGIFSVVAKNIDVSYQWEVLASGGAWRELQYATEASYSFVAMLNMNGNQYRCKVNNGYEEIYSSSAVLNITENTGLSLPRITSNPESSSVSEGDQITLSVIADGENLAYQWQLERNGNWYTINGATNSTYSLTASLGISGTKYRCLVSNDAGAVSSNIATIFVIKSQDDISTPSIQIQPRSVTVADGAVAMFATSASGGSLYFQWQVKRNGQWYNITGATNSVYTVAARSSMNGEQYRCQITNSAGTVYTNIVQLTVQSSAPLEFYGYHSLIISGKNTYGEWEMYPTSRPHVAPPEVKTSYVDVPGANGGLDYTDLLTGDPRYGYRKGSWEFLLIPQEKWPDVYRSLCNFLHGKIHTVVLEDDPTWQYTGRLQVNQWKSEQHNSLITIDYVLDPIPVNLEDETYDQDADDLALASRILRKSANEGKVIALVNNQAMLVYPEDYFEDGDEILY